MKVYVASKFENQAEVRKAITLLREHGHDITFDWTQHSAVGKSGQELQDYLRLCAVDDYDGVLFAEALVLIDHPNCKAAYTELGMALAMQARVIVVNAVPTVIDPTMHQNIFMHLPEVEHVDSIEEAVAILDKMEEHAQ